MRYFVFLWLVIHTFFNAIYAAGAHCFTYEVFDHVAAPGAAPAFENRALTNYPHAQIHLNHGAVLTVATPVQVRLGRFAAPPPAPWDVNLPFVGPPPHMDLANINLIIARRLAHGVVIASALTDNLAAANAAGAITPALITSLRAGGYLNNMSAILNRLTLGIFPLGTILGVPVPAFIPDSVIVHVALPQRASKNLNELSHSSLATAVPGGLTLKDKINAPYALLAWPVPDSATIVSSDHLQ
ncbi:MAG: hypothetical protein WCN27_00845 [Alphaproteobacteria bacterium]